MFLVALVFGFAAGLWADARARQAVRALDHHATVLHGAVVGSAFAIAEGVGVTNAHVVRGLRPGGSLTVVMPGRARTRVVAKLLAVSGRMDLAVLKLPPGLLPVVPGVSAGNQGQRVIAAGVDASGGAGAGALMELSGQVITPRADLSAFGPGLVADLPGVRPGFSGGPMLDGRGRLVGMVTAIRPGTPPHRPTTAASGFAPEQAAASQAQEAFVLRGPAILAEVRRLLGSGRD